jgi:hypothetical protein
MTYTCAPYPGPWSRDTWRRGDRPGRSCRMFAGAAADTRRSAALGSIRRSRLGCCRLSRGSVVGGSSGLHCSSAMDSGCRRSFLARSSGVGSRSRPAAVPVSNAALARSPARLGCRYCCLAAWCCFGGRCPPLRREGGVMFISGARGSTG